MTWKSTTISGNPIKDIIIEGKRVKKIEYESNILYQLASNTTDFILRSTNFTKTNGSGSCTDYGTNGIKTTAVYDGYTNVAIVNSDSWELECDYYCSTDNRQRFGYAYNNGSSITNAEFFSRDVGVTRLWNFKTDVSNFLSSGQHHVKIIRDGTDWELQYDSKTYTTSDWNPPEEMFLRLNKWQNGYQIVENLTITQ